MVDFRKLKALTPAGTRLRKTAAEPKAGYRLSLIRWLY